MEYAYLRVKSDRGERPAQLSSIPLTIGRHESNRLILDDNMASRFHCVIEKGAEGYILRDLQSRNGTLLNGQRVMNSALKTGDVIAIGAVNMTVVIHAVSKTLAGAKGNVAAGNAVSAADAVDEIEEIALDDLEVIGSAPEAAAAVAPLAVVRKTAEAMLNKDFEAEAISLLDTRGKSLHDGQKSKGVPSEISLLLKLVLLICFRSHASDIHLEPREQDFLLRLRMDGSLLDIVALPRDMGTRFCALVKVLCELDTTQKAIVQEGHFSSRAPNKSKQSGQADTLRRVDYRVSFVPSLHGQKLVIRIFDTANAPVMINDLNLPPAVALHINEELTKDSGLILVCGPTGSGKTTTLYSLLRTCGSSFRNIITIEDPVEVQIDGTTQLPVDEEAGKSFAALLRSVLRQDPDVIMVGEIRDPETARIALQAAMTGHLVLSTIHTRDTVGTIFRLLDLGIEPFMVSQGIQLVLAQRLVRALCQSCRRAFSPTPEDRKRMGPAGENVEKIYAPVGCPKCLGTGYYSRRAFFEFMVATPKLREYIVRNPSITDMQQVLGDEFMTLATHGYQLVAAGVTSIDEVDRAISR